VRGWKDDATGLEQRLKDLETISRTHRLRRVMVAFGFALGLVGWGFGAVKTRPTTMVLVAGGAAFLNEILGLIHERGWYRWWLVYALSLFDVLLVAVLIVWFGRGGFVATAMRAQAPIVPIAVIGAEEAAPIFAHVTALQRLTGLLYFPITPTFPHFGLAGMLGYLPAKFRIRFLEPIPTDEWGPDGAEDRALVQTVAAEIRARIQDELLEMVSRRRSVWFG